MINALTDDRQFYHATSGDTTIRRVKTMMRVLNHINGFNEARCTYIHIIIQTFNSKRNESIGHARSERRGRGKKLIDNNQHWRNKKQYFLSLSLIMVAVKSHSHLWRSLT